MHWLALAADYDGTLATDGRVGRATLKALLRLKASGKRLILVTGRRLDDLIKTFPEHGLFDCIVAENGALLYDPCTRNETLLCAKANRRLVRVLQRGRVNPLYVGQAIVATCEPHGRVVHEAIAKLGLELDVILNKGAIMVLPAGVNKASGLRWAALELGLSLRRIAAIGDAENDLSFIKVCGYGVAVANALPALKERADLVTRRGRGAGVAEFIEGEMLR